LQRAGHWTECAPPGGASAAVGQADENEHGDRGQEGEHALRDAEVVGVAPDEENRPTPATASRSRTRKPMSAALAAARPGR
jgi:hypothetical protein